MNDSDITYSELFSAVFNVNNFSTIVYFGQKESCQIENWLRWTEIPLILWSSIASMRLNRFVDAELILLVCLPGVYRPDLLRTVSGLLQYMRLSKLVIELASNLDVDLINRVLQFCYQNHMLNVILLLEDFGKTHILYSFDAYPIYKMKSLEFGKDIMELYAEQGVDLKGCILRTQPDLSDPNTILYYDQQGNPRILGYVWNMVVEFARKHNARLELSSLPLLTKRLGHIEMLDLARDGYVDIAASVQPITMRYVHRYHEYAYPVHMGSWCTMLPMENLIDLGDSYVWLMPVMTIAFLILLWIMYELLKGRWQQLDTSWLILAVLLLANIQGRLYSLFIAPASFPHIKNFGELYQTKIRILGMRSESFGYDLDVRTKYSSLFKLIDDGQELFTLRNSLNASFAYTVTHTKWLLYKELQSRLNRNVFYFSTDLCYYQFMPFALVVPENSPHREALDYFMMQLTQSGLYAYWTSKSFDYMNQAGILEIPKLSETIKLRSLMLKDLHVFLCAFAVGMVISLLVLAGEIFIFLFRRWMYF